MSYEKFVRERGQSALAAEAAKYAADHASGRSNWRGLFTRIERTGSREICDPPPLDTDEDYVCFMRKNPSDVYEALEAMGFTPCDANEYDDQIQDWRAFRRGKLNLIVTHCTRFYNGFVLATLIAKDMNLTRKEDRVALFRSMREHYGAHVAKK